VLEISGLTWAVTIGLIVVLLAVDLVIAAVRPHRVGFREAAAWSILRLGGDRVRRLVPVRARR
jgi:tellurite resistance protein TerC